MKTQSKLEKIIKEAKDAAKSTINSTINSIKKNAKIGLITTPMLFGTINQSLAETIEITPPAVYDYYSGFDLESKGMQIQHLAGANEMQDPNDIPRESFDVMVQDGIFMKASSDPYFIPLWRDAQGEILKSPMSDVLVKVNLWDVEKNKGYISYPQEVLTSHKIYSASEQINIICERYNDNDANNPNNILNKYDINWVSNNKLSPELTKGQIPHEGFNNKKDGDLIYQWKYKFFNHADLNRDRKVNMQDYAIFAGEYGKNTTTDPERFGANVGSNVNDLGAYADINRDGSVDSGDLASFTAEWLWDANDSSTW